MGVAIYVSRFKVVAGLALIAGYRWGEILEHYEQVVTVYAVTSAAGTRGLCTQRKT